LENETSAGQRGNQGNGADGEGSHAVRDGHYEEAHGNRNEAGAKCAEALQPAIRARVANTVRTAPWYLATDRRPETVHHEARPRDGSDVRADGYGTQRQYRGIVARMLGRLVRKNRDRRSDHRGDAQVESPLIPLKGAEGGIDSEC